MKKNNLLVLLLFLAANYLFAQSLFKVEGSNFILNWKTTKIYSGEIHYTFIPYEYWKDRLLKIKATDLNTLSAYAYWDVHKPKPGVWDFWGDNNITGIIHTKKEVGLNVILRPGLRI